MMQPTDLDAALADRLAGTVPDLLDRFAEQTPDKTAVCFLNSMGGAQTIDAAGLRRRAWGIAHRILEAGGAGERVLLLLPPGIDYIASFMGCLYAGMVAVPAYPLDTRNISSSLERLGSIVEDCEAQIALVNPSDSGEAQCLPELPGLPARLTWVDVAAAPLADEPPPISRQVRDSVAFLQYTSGSTGDPHGVEVTHRNLLENLTAMHLAFEHNEASAVASWLPPYHDMGLIGGILLPIFGGLTSWHMAPTTFIRRPALWLRAISEGRVTTTFAPNFAFDYIVTRLGSEDIAGFDLSCWHRAVNGAEPVRAASLERFAEFAKPAGFRREALAPAYGLAEATLMVTASPADRDLLVVELDREALAEGRAVKAEHAGGVVMVGCGHPARNTNIRIVDPESRVQLQEGRVGEVWVAGPGVARGYRGRVEQSAEIFRAHLADDEGEEYLRTGDLGFILDGDLFLTGRVKDLIIDEGRNIYPPDVEELLEREMPELRRGYGAVFGTMVDGRERVVVVYEPVRRGAADPGQLLVRMRSVLASHTGVTPLAVLLVPMGTSPRTTSGKIRRAEFRRLFENLRLRIDAVSLLDLDALQLDDARSLKSSTLPPDTPLADLGIHFADLLCHAAMHPWLDVGKVLREPVLGSLGNDMVASASISSVEDTAAEVKKILSELLGVAPGHIDEETPLRDLGIGSRQTVMLCERLSRRRGVRMNPEFVFDHPTVSALAQALPVAQDVPGPAPLVSTPPEGPVVITGLSCRLPGADTPRAFEKMLLEGATGIGPAERTGLSGRLAGWIEPLAAFDTKAFGISEREAMTMDPQHALALVACCQALEDAGYDWREPPTRRMGVFVGISSSDSAFERQASGAPPDLYEATGMSHAVAANRVSYLLNLTGPSMAVDTACSSSLTALHLALQSVRHGECDAALVVGVSHLRSPRFFEALEDGQMLALDGRPRGFAQGAAGYVRGEGVAALFLRRSQDAQAAGERAYATVRGSALSHVGKTNGLTAPSSSSQAAVLRAALEDAGTKSSEVAFVESHGTGTALGDPIELAALSEVYGRGRETSSPLLLGVVKNNIGHLEAAAGIAGIVKAALIIESGVVPPVVGVEAPTEHFGWEGSGLILPHEPALLPSDVLACVAVSSFGFGGALGHVILGPPEGLEARRPSARALRIEAADCQGLRDAAARIADEVDRSRGVDVPLPAMAGGRERLVVIASEPGNACEALRATVHGGRHPDAIRWSIGSETRGATLFLLPGQGSLSPGAAGGLNADCESFALALDRLCGELEVRGVHAAKDLLVDPAADPDSLRRTEVQQPLLVALQLALAEALAQHAVVPNLLLGHSAGEITAAVLAGVLSEAEAMDLAVLRGEAMAAVPPGAMIACRASASELAEILAACPTWRVAAFNEPSAVVLAGAETEAERLLMLSAEAGLPARRLSVNHAFHTPAVAEAVEVLRDVGANCVGRQAERTWISSFTGRPVEEISADYWVSHAIQPVRFGDALACAGGSGLGLAVELGVRTLTGAALRILPESTCVVPLLDAGHGAQAFLRALATAEAAGLEVDWGPENKRPTRRPRRVFTNFTRESATRASSAGRQAKVAGATRTEGGEAMGMRWLDRTVILHEISKTSGFSEDRIAMQDRLHSDLGLDSLMISALARSLAERGPFSREQLMDKLSGDPTIKTALLALGAGPNGKVDEGGSVCANPETASQPHLRHTSENDVVRPATTMFRHGSRRNVALWSEAREVADRFAKATDGAANPYERIHEGFNGAHITVGGRPMVNFSSFDYLGLSHHPEVRRRAVEAIETYGTSAAATPLLYGETPLHRELESAIAELVGTESAIVFAGGHATNVGTVSHLMGAEDLIIHDEWSHDSCVRGALLSGATRRSYRHNDLESLDGLLTQLRGSHRRALICAEGAYSQDGDLPDLPGLALLADKHDALLMVDEAHSIGVIGETGRGIGEAQNVCGTAIDLWMGTLSKALGSLGGYIAGSREMVEYLRYSAPLYLFSTGPSPANAAAALASVHVLRNEPERVRVLHDRADLFRRLASEAGLDTGVSRESAVVPVIVGEWAQAVNISNQMFRCGFNAMPIGYPAVSRDAARIRFFINAEHEEYELEEAVGCIADLLGGRSPAGVTRLSGPGTQASPSLAVPLPRDGAAFPDLEARRRIMTRIDESCCVSREQATAYVTNPDSAVGRPLTERLQAKGFLVVAGTPAAEQPGLVFDCVGTDGVGPVELRQLARGSRVVRVAWSDALPPSLSTHDEGEQPLRGDGEAVLFAEAKALGIELTVLAAHAVYGPGCRGTVVTAAALAHAGIVDDEMASQPAPLVCTINLAAAAVQAAGSEATHGRRMEIADPHGLTWGRYLCDLFALTSEMAVSHLTVDLGPAPTDRAGFRAGVEAMDVFWTDRPWRYPRALAETATWWWSH